MPPFVLPLVIVLLVLALPVWIVFTIVKEGQARTRDAMLVANKPRVATVPRATMTAAERGAEGEAMTRELLERGLDPDLYTLFHDLLLNAPKSPSGKTQIDHLVVSRFGLAVIETKNMQGWIFGKPDDRMWTFTFPDGTKQPRPNPVLQNAGHAKALAAQVKVDRSTILELVYMAGSAEAKSNLGSQVYTDGTALILALQESQRKGLEQFSRGMLLQIIADLRRAEEASTKEAKDAHSAALIEHYANGGQE